MWLAEKVGSYGCRDAQGICRQLPKYLVPAFYLGRIRTRCCALRRVPDSIEEQILPVVEKLDSSLDHGPSQASGLRDLAVTGLVGDRRRNDPNMIRKAHRG